jgi:hypothetical protein
MAGLVVAAVTLPARSAPGGSRMIAACSPSAGAKHGASIGEVLQVPSQSAYVRSGGKSKSGVPVGQHFPLFAGNLLCTNGLGEVAFKLHSGGTSAKCDAGSDSRLTLAVHDHRVVINLLQSHPYLFGCDSSSALIRTPQKTAARSSRGPVFAIRVGPDRSVITVGQGFLNVDRPAGGPPVIVGPDAQVVVSANHTSSAVPPGALDSEERSLLNKLEAGLPAPRYAAPTSQTALTPKSKTALKRSPALQRIRRHRTIVVGLDDGLKVGLGKRVQVPLCKRSKSSPEGAFVKAYFTFLARRWKVKLSFQCDVKPVAAQRLLRTGQIDLLVSRGPLSGTLSAPLFAGQTGRSVNKWSVVVKSDPVFLGALTTFLQAALDSGVYNRLYRSSLAQPPVYQVVAPLIFPPVACAPRATADLTSDIDLALTLSASASGPLRPGATVVQTATVTNVGKRIVDCVTLHLHLFGRMPLDYRILPAGCKRSPLPSGNATDEIELSCELGRFGLGSRKSLRIVVKPASPFAPTQTCADVNADESGGLPEVNRGDNSACVQLVYRGAPLAVGVVEDNAEQPPDPRSTIPAPLGDLDPKARFDLLDQAGFGEVVLTAGWVRGKTAPSAVEIAKLEHAATAAKLDGMDIVLAVYNFDKDLTAAQDTPVTASQRADFASYAAALARALPAARQFIIGNEPNNEQFWSPQYGPGSSDVAASAYEALLAKTYDALKAVDPGITVIGGALAPRGAMEPKPGVRDTHAPGMFITDLGSAYRIAYRRGARMKPIMDAFALHPIPESPDVPPGTQHPSPATELGIADYPVLVSLLGRAFDGTGQAGSTLPIYYTEYAVQTAGTVGGQGKQGATASVSTQALYYRQAIALASCQPSVKGIFFFHGFDEANLAGWQSGVYYADGMPKQSLPAVRTAALAARSRAVSSCPPSGSIP